MADIQTPRTNHNNNVDITVKVHPPSGIGRVQRGRHREGHVDTHRSKTLPPSKPPRIGSVFESGFTARRRHGDTAYTVGIVIGPQLEADSK